MRRTRIASCDRTLGLAASLFVSLYTEREADISLEASLARGALDKVTAYFGSLSRTTPWSWNI